MLGLPLEIAGRMGSLAATYAVEQHGTQEHVYTAEEFVRRFDHAFADYAGAVEVEWLNSAVERQAAVDRLSRVGARGD